MSVEVVEVCFADEGFKTIVMTSTTLPTNISWKARKTVKLGLSNRAVQRTHKTRGMNLRGQDFADVLLACDQQGGSCRRLFFVSDLRFWVIPMKKFLTR